MVDAEVVGRALERWSLSPGERAYAVALARAVVERSAPDELPLFDLRSRRFYRRPLPRFRNDVLRSDLGTTLACVSDAALAAGQGAVVFMIGLAAEQVAERVSLRWWARLRRRFTAAERPAIADRVWTPQELARIQAASIAAGQGRIDPETLKAISMEIVARLALGTGGEKAGGERASVQKAGSEKAGGAENGR